ncbi:MAG: hypothetical protein ACI849_001883 [Patiriisocius sp.]|jgi:hypothetical protein
MLENKPVAVKIKLAALWASIMSLYIYADFFDGMTPRSIEMSQNLETPVGPLTPNLLLIFSLILIIPSCMMFLSVFLKPIINKWINIIVASLWSIMSFISLINTISSEWYQFYALFQASEIVIFGMIVWQAWIWPKVKEA